MSQDFDKATLRKAAVTTLPLWVNPEQDQPLSPGLSRLQEEDYEDRDQNLFLNSALTSTSDSSTGRSSTSTANCSHTKENPGIPTYASAPLSKGTQKSHYSTSNRSRRRQGSTLSNGHPQQDWSVFATMSNVSTVSERLGRKLPNALGPFGSPSTSGTLASSAEPPSTTFAPGAGGAISSLKRFPLKLDEVFRPKTTGHIADIPPAGTTGTTIGTAATSTSLTHSNNNSSSVCTCVCPQHNYQMQKQQQQQQPSFAKQRGRLGMPASKRRNKKESLEMMRGYPTGQCISSDPPEHTNWDEKDAEDLSQANRQSAANNTAFNLDALKAFLNSPLFSNFLKSLTIMAAVSLFAISLDAIIILVRTPDDETRLSTNDNAALIITLILSILTIAYSCFTIFLESRRPPEGLDTSNSKPLIVIFSEIIASIVWAQVLSVTIYIYIWTYGCTEAGQQQLERLWQHNGQMRGSDHRLTARLCRRQGAMVGLELLLVMLVIFNFYTHLAQNFKFIRAVS